MAAKHDELFFSIEELIIKKLINLKVSSYDKNFQRTSGNTIYYGLPLKI